MIPAECLKLTLEQQFKLKMLDADIDRLAPEDARDIVREFPKQLEIKDNILKYFVAKDAGII
jgi:hypothetical protein